MVNPVHKKKKAKHPKIKDYKENKLYIFQAEKNESKIKHNKSLFPSSTIIFWRASTEDT